MPPLPYNNAADKIKVEILMDTALGLFYAILKNWVSVINLSGTLLKD